MAILRRATDALVLGSSAVVGLCLVAYWWLLSLPLLRLLRRRLYGVKQRKTTRTTEEDQTPGPWKHARLRTNGVSLHYAYAGERGRPLMLLVHGFPESWYSWRHQLVEFARDYYVVAVDMRGYNTSDAPVDWADYALSELTADVEGAVRALGYQSCTLVGHDWGGAVSWAVAYRYRALVERLVILNMPHPRAMGRALRRNAQQVRRSWYIFFFQLPFLPERLVGRGRPGNVVYRDLINKKAMSQTDIDVLNACGARAAPGSPRGPINYYRNLFTLQNLLHPACAGELLTPTLIIWGQRDKYLGKEMLPGTERWVKNLSIKHIEEASHWVQQDQPATVNAMMREWLGGTSGGNKKAQ